MSFRKIMRFTHQKTANGHDVYVRYLETHSPVGRSDLNAQFIGVGSELNSILSL